MSATEVSPSTRPPDDAPPTSLIAPVAEANGHGHQRSAAPHVSLKAGRSPVARPGARTTRVFLRKVDAWTVLKLSLVYYLALFAVILVAGILLWAGASAVGVVGNVEGFMIDIGFENFRFIPSRLFLGVALGGGVLVIVGTCANVLMAALFNLMSDVVGGIKLTLQEEGGDSAPAPEPGKASV